MTLHLLIALGTACLAASAPALANPDTVSDFPEARPFCLTGTELDRLLHKEPAASVRGTLDLAAFGDRGWTLIKYGGNVYLRGWIAKPGTAGELEGQTCYLSNQAVVPDNGKQPILVTLGLNGVTPCGFFQRVSAPGFLNPKYNGMEEQILFSGVHLDDHAWEAAGAAPPAMISLPDVPPPPSEEELDRNLQNAQVFMGSQGIPLSQFPDETPFVLRTDQFICLLSDIPAERFRAIATKTTPDHLADMGEWLFVKHGGRIYVRAWATAAPSPTAIRRLVRLCNFDTMPNSVPALHPITLPIDGIHYVPYGRVYMKAWYVDPIKGLLSSRFEEQVLVSGIQPDEHSEEKWQP